MIGCESLLRSLLSLEVTGDIDELTYLERHRDVATAVAEGRLRCGREHHIFQGYFERRSVRFPGADPPAPEPSE